MSDVNATSKKPLLDVEGLTVEFSTSFGWCPAVRNVSLQIRRNEVLGLVGESGSGKSVAAMSLLGLLPRDGTRISGDRIQLDGTELLGASSRELDRVRGPRVGMIFQDPMSSLNPAYNIGEQIAEGVRKHLGLNRKDAWKRAVELLSRVGIPNPARNAERYPHHFSGGMRQRAMIAMALACDPELLIADEPTTALDVTVQSMVLELIVELQEESDMSVLLITHDLAVVSEVADRVAVMYAGQIIEVAPTRELYERPRHPYTSGLLSSILDLNAIGKFTTIKGSVPPIYQEYPGCRFADRCDFVTESCTSSPVEFYDEGTHGHRCRRADEITLGGAL